jgi:hypothetical protein
MALPDPAEFLACERDLFLRPAPKHCVVFGMAFRPLSLHKCMCGASIEWVVTYINALLLNFGIAKEIGPILNVVDLDSLTRHDFGCSSWRSREREDQELMVVENLTVCTGSGVD